MLREISALWSLIHVLVIFAMFFESRYSRIKTKILIIAGMIPLIILNIAILILAGPETIGKVLFISCTLPSLIYFFILSKHRDGRFLFTFCVADTVSLEIVYITNLLDFYISPSTNIFMFVSRLIMFPVLEYGIYMWLRGPFLKVQNTVKKGWTGFALISAIFYGLLLIMFSYPTLVTERPEDIPAVIVVMLLMPFIYWCIFFVLFKQNELYETKEREHLLLVQSSMLQQRIDETSRIHNEISIQRHDLRHRLQTIDTILEKGDVPTARDYIASSQETLAETKVKRWCGNKVLDAVFAYYFRQAEAAGIRIEADLDIPENIHIDAVELSTVFANAIENAILAVSELAEAEKVIKCKCIHYPQLMLRVSNPYRGEIRFDVYGRPEAQNPAHGIGTRSIAAYCEKHGAYCEYKTENGWFTLQIIQP